MKEHTAKFIEELREILLEGYEKRGQKHMVEMIETIDLEQVQDIVEYLLALLMIGECDDKASL